MLKNEYQRRWRAANPDRIALYNSRRRESSQTKACEECGSAFTTTRNSGKITKRFCTAECREAVRRRRPGKSVGARTRQRVLTRSGWRCYLCLHAIDPALRWPHPLSGTVDHFVPRSAGGSDRLDNLRAAHWHCNEEKGHRLPGTEVWVPGAA